MNDTLLYTHVGDCRVYLFRNQRAEQITTDETFVQLMADVGVIDAADMKHHPMRNVVLNCVGTHTPDRTPVMHSESLLPGDRIVLTTDGVTDYLDTEDMERILTEVRESSEAAQAIVSEALELGSRDNASCVVVSVQESPTKVARRDALHQELDTLHTILGDHPELDDSLCDELRQISLDIKQALHERSSEDHLQPLATRLQAALAEFEKSHPRLTGVAGGIAEMLSNLGI